MHHVTALNPGQSRPTTSCRPGASRLLYTVDGRALLPDYQTGDDKNVIAILEALMQVAWSELYFSPTQYTILIFTNCSSITATWRYGLAHCHEVSPKLCR